MGGEKGGRSTGLKVRAKSEMVAQLSRLITSNSWVSYEVGQMSVVPATLCMRCACVAVPAPVTQAYTGPVMFEMVGIEDSMPFPSVNLLASLHMSKVLRGVGGVGG